jgi:hypothetical protein
MSYPKFSQLFLRSFTLISKHNITTQKCEALGHSSWNQLVDLIHLQFVASWL